MTALDIRTEYQHQDVHRVTITEEQLKELGIAAVARQVGSDPTGPNLKVRAWISCLNSGSLSSPKYGLEVELKVDHKRDEQTTGLTRPSPTPQPDPDSKA